MFCLECGGECPDDAEFCHNCGTKVGGDVESTEGGEPDPAPTNTARSAAPNRPRAVRPTPSPIPVTRLLSAGSKYMGASIVIVSLLITGWLIAFLGIVAGFAVANECEDVLDEECGTGVRIGLFVGIMLVSWFVAVGFLWAAYALRLLSDIELRARSDQGTNRIDRPRR